MNGLNMDSFTVMHLFCILGEIVLLIGGYQVMLTSLEQWKEWRNESTEKKYTMFPLCKEIPLELDGARNVSSWEEIWRDASPYAFVLESGKTGRYTYLGLQPSSVIQGKGLSATSLELNSHKKDEKRWEGKPLDVVRAWLRPYRSPRLPGGPKWSGGCMGFWGYDVARTIEKLPVIAQDDLAVPDYLFMRMNQIWAIDHEQQKVYCIYQSYVDDDADEQELHSIYDKAFHTVENMAQYWVEQFHAEQSLAQERRQQRMALIDEQSMHEEHDQLTGMSTPFSKASYEDAVRAIQRYIGQGDVFQVNLSLRQSKPITVSPEELYEWLRLVNPSPYMGFLRCPEFQLVSGSPELLVELVDGRLAARPIAGTRRRGRSEEEDARLAEELAGNEKENAEHVMLVDLERNDLGRISAYGSVHVKELMVIERYSHVMHLVSQVEGRLAEGKDAFDVIAAKFPGGTITGAPKIRTMEIIEELEPVRRGPYTGSMGWIDYNGDMEFNIIIRTMVLQGSNAHIQAGAGIVIDSDPEREYYESLSKAKALWKAIQYSEQFKKLHNSVAE